MTNHESSVIGAYRDYLDAMHSFPHGQIISIEIVEQHRQQRMAEVSADWTPQDFEEFASWHVDFLEETAEHRRQEAEDTLPVPQERLSEQQAQDIYAFITGAMREGKALHGLMRHDVAFELLVRMQQAYPQYLVDFNPDKHLEEWTQTASDG